MSYTVYAIRTELLGDSSLVTDEDTQRMDALLDEELVNADITDVRIVMTDAQGYSDLPYGDETLQPIVDAAFARFHAEVNEEV